MNITDLKNIKRDIEIQGGFSLIELIVVIAIFGIIMSVALFNQGQLNNNVLLTNLAYEVALGVRETQAYGIGVRTTETGSQSTFQGGYGISFDPRNFNELVTFNDKDNDLKVGVGEEASRYTIQNQRGNMITDICVGSTALTAVCSGADKLVNIVFRRPNPEAQFIQGTRNGSSINYASGDNLTTVYIVVSTPSRDNCRVVIVEQSGQIRVEGKNGGHC